MQLQNTQTMAAEEGMALSKTGYGSVRSGLRSLLRGGGREMFTGVSMSMTSSIGHQSLHFVFYDQVKKYWMEKQGRKLKLGEVFLISGTMKATACALFHPCGLIMTRMQDLRNKYDAVRYGGVRDAVKTIARTEGFAGFYRGIWPHAIKSFPTGGLALMFYELFVLLLQKMQVDKY